MLHGGGSSLSWKGTSGSQFFFGYPDFFSTTRRENSKIKSGVSQLDLAILESAQSSGPKVDLEATAGHGDQWGRQPCFCSFGGGEKTMRKLEWLWNLCGICWL